MAGLRLWTTVEEILEAARSFDPERRFTARELALEVVARRPAEVKTKLDASAALHTHDDVIQQIVAEIGSQRQRAQAAGSNVRVTEDKPRLYYWSTDGDIEAQADWEDVERRDERARMTGDDSLGGRPPGEHALYPVLATFLSSMRSPLASQRIDEKASSNRRGAGGNHWLFPDLVAMENMTTRWSTEVRDCVVVTGARRARLWSFEVKIALRRGDVRKSFFQAVSNSSWANFAYLVAADVDEAAADELRILSALHGVGVIKLDQDEPAESRILIPARERMEIDWDNCDRLAKENGDFRGVMERFWSFHKTGRMEKGWSS